MANTALSIMKLRSLILFKQEGQTQSLTEWQSIILWCGLADLAEKYLRKGTIVYLEVEKKTRSYDDKQGSKWYVTKIIGDHILILDKKEP